MKKEGIFIIDPTLDRKLSTLPPVYIPPPFATSRISPLDTPDVNIKQVVNELAMVTLIPSQNSGFFIFSVWNSPLKELLYRIIWCSRPVLMSLIQALVTVGLGLFVLEYPDIVYAFLTSRSQTGKENGTMSVTEVVLNGTILVSDIVGSIIFIRERERIQQFMNKLQSSITSLAEEVRDAPWLAEWFETTITNTRRLVNSINVAVIPTTLVLCWPQLCAIYGALLGGTWEYLDFIVWSFPLFSLGWCLTLFRRLHFRVLIMSTIDCLQFGFRCIREQVQQIGSEMEAASSPIPRGDFQVIRRKVPEMDNQDDLGTEDQKGHLGRHSLEAYLREARLNAILDKYRTMELLLQEFNELFAPHLLIGVVSIVVVILLSIFHLYVEITPHQSVKAVFYGVTTFVYILVMYLLGSAATEMASQADSCITALREVPLTSIKPVLKQKIMLHFQHAMAVPLVVSPGYFFLLNKNMLTSVAGTLTTYLIVLIQFQTSDLPGRKGHSDNTTLGATTGKPPLMNFTEATTLSGI